MKARPPASPDAHAEAVAWHRARLPMTDADFKALESQSYDQAFTIAKVAQLDVVSDVWEALDQAIAQGETLDDFRARIEEKLTAAWGKEEPYRIETIFRTNIQRSYSAGRYEQMSHPAVLEARPFWRFVSIEDQRLCVVCSACDGIILPADHLWWKTHIVPMHMSCRCRTDTVSAREAGDNVTSEPPDAAPADGFGAPPSNDPWVPDLEDYPLPLVAAFKE